MRNGANDMKLTRRGEIVFAFSSIFTALTLSVALVAGVVFVSTHHQVTDQSSCKQTIEGVMCDFTWERK